VLDFTVTFCLSTVKQNPVDSIEQRELLKTAFVDQVLRYQHHPALMGWIFGNEVHLRVFFVAFILGVHANFF
jgi:endo-1,4-beta-mannosidase